jgi:ATP adenylyltransferase
VAEHRLWAPWRLEYIQSPKPEGCILCAKPAEGDDDATWIVHRGVTCFVMLNAFPYNNGHVMISPYAHAGSVEELGPEMLTELMTLTQASLAALRGAYGPEGFNIGINQGRIAGAGVEGHVHQHVVPRWGADTNFMPVIGDTRVLPQRLDDSLNVLREHWP